MRGESERREQLLPFYLLLSSFSRLPCSFSSLFFLVANCRKVIISSAGNG